MLRSILLKINTFINSFGYSIVKKDENSFLDQSKIIENPKVIFDVGSNRGGTVTQYLQLFANANIYSIEPIADLLSFQKQKFYNNKRVNFVGKVFSDINGSVEFNINETSDTSSLLKSNTEFIPNRYGNVYKTFKTIEVEAIRLDEFCELNNIDKIDILKIDVQGAELKVLLGAEKMLKAGNIKLIYCECLFLPFYVGQCFFDDIVAYLNFIGYRLYSSYDFHFNSKTGKVMQCDSIFVHKSLEFKEISI